jgi:hypothetical protein
MYDAPITSLVEENGYVKFSITYLAEEAGAGGFLKTRDWGKGVL